MNINRLFRLIPFVITQLILLFCFLLIVNACYKYHLETEERRQLLKTVKCDKCLAFVKEKQTKEKENEKKLIESINKVEEKGEKGIINGNKDLQGLEDNLFKNCLELEETKEKKIMPDKFKISLSIFKENTLRGLGYQYLYYTDNINENDSEYIKDSTGKDIYKREYNIKTKEETRRINYNDEKEFYNLIKYKNKKIFEIMNYQECNYKDFTRFREDGTILFKIFFDETKKRNQDKSINNIQCFDENNKLIKEIFFCDNGTTYTTENSVYQDYKINLKKPLDQNEIMKKTFEKPVKEVLDLYESSLNLKDSKDFILIPEEFKKVIDSFKKIDKNLSEKEDFNNIYMIDEENEMKISVFKSGNIEKIYILKNKKPVKFIGFKNYKGEILYDTRVKE